MAEAPRFRSWVEDFRAAPEQIDNEAFRFRRVQRGITRAAERSIAVGTIQGAGNKAIYFAQRDIADRVCAQARQADPVLRAQLHLQRAGYTVYRASVLAADADGWVVGGRANALDDAALIALAVARGMVA